MSKSVRLADIAAKLNVSTVTVSKALSGQKGVSENMREKIKGLAKEMGYQPPAKVKLPKDGKGYNIGVVISERYLDQQETFYWKMYQEVATGAVAEECFTMLEILNQQSEQEKAMPKLLIEDKVDGLIIIGLLKEDYLAMIQESIKVPLVCLDFYDRRHECDAVITDNYYGMYQLTNHLFEMGHTKIGYVGTLLYTGSITDRYFGYCKALLEHGQKVREDWVIEDRNRETGFREEGFEFKLPKEMPTAFACNCDITAGVLTEVLRKKGYRVPEDISIVGYDNYLYPGVCSLEITTYEVDIREMAFRAIQKLIKKMAGEVSKQGILIIEGRILLKESVKNLTCNERGCRS